MIYLDNAATSWPKPEAVTEAMARFLHDIGASPGRSAHRLALAAERQRFDAREAVAALFGAGDPSRVIFTFNATTALNLVLEGLLSPGTHVVTSGMEHNAVMRPLRALRERGVTVTVLPSGPDGRLTPESLDAHLRPETAAVVVNHASNVCGTLQPVRALGARARERGVPLLVDAAQTGGCWPINVRADEIDLLVFSGHKGLLGPTGTGGLVFGERFDIAHLPPLIRGGTGSRSEHEEQPAFLPDKYEAGTPNTVGLAGLLAGVQTVLERGVGRVRAQEEELTERLLAGLQRIEGVRIVGPRHAHERVAVVSFNLAGYSCAELAQALDERYGILCRPGLHCAPRAHQTLGTYPEGTVRFSLGPYTTAADIDAALAAVADLARTSPHG